MSTKRESSATESPPLFNYLREEIPIEDMRDYSSPDRIESIDFVKGFAIVFIMLAHCSSVWLDNDWFYIYGLVYAGLDILGPSLFVFLSALSVIFSIKRKKGRLPEKVIRNRIFSRGLSIIAIGILYNLVALSPQGIPFPYNLWGWNILMFIGFSQIFSYYSLKFGKITRVVIGLVIVYSSESIREMLFFNQDVNIIYGFLHYIVSSPGAHLPILPWLAICFISTIFGEILYEAMIKGTDQAYMHLFKTFLGWGLFFIFIGVFRGYELQTPETLAGGITLYPHLDLLRIMNLQEFFHVPGMPLFLIRSTASNMFYSLGAALAIIAICFYFIDIRKGDNYFTGILKYYGKLSLSMFLLHYPFLTIFLRAFNIVIYPFVELAFIGFMGFMMYIWFEYGNGVGTPEWFMIQIGRIGEKTGEEVKKGSKIVAESTKKVYSKTEEFIRKAGNSFKLESEKIAQREIDAEPPPEEKNSDSKE
ncbi:MAG: acyltransferase family protein [Promethearchaeia archaeon]